MSNYAHDVWATAAVAIAICVAVAVGVASVAWVSGSSDAISGLWGLVTLAFLKIPAHTEASSDSAEEQAR